MEWQQGKESVMVDGGRRVEDCRKGAVRLDQSSSSSPEWRTVAA